MLHKVGKSISRQESKFLQIPSFLIVLTFASLLTIWRLTYVTLWSDEFRGTLTLIRLPWVDLITGHYSWEFNPPLYFLTLKTWISLLGSDTEIVMRMLSVILWLSSLATLFFLGKTLANCNVGIALMLAIAFHPDFLVYSTQLRMYPLLIFLSSLALLSYTQYSFGENRQWGWLVALGVVLVLANYTHYFGVFLSLIILVFCLFILIVNKDRGQYPVLGIILLAWLLTIPLLGIFWQQYQQYVEKTSSLSNNLQSLSPAILIPMLSGHVSLQINLNYPGQILSLIGVVCGSVILFRNHKSVYALSLLSSIIISVVMVMAITIMNINIAPRYLLPIYILPWIIIALSFILTNDKSSKVMRIAAIIAITVSGLHGIRDVLNRDYGPDWRNVALILLHEIDDGEQIVIMGWDAAPTGYYLERPWLTSYGLEEQLSSGNTAKSYLIVDSQYARRLDFIDYSQPIYQNPDWQVKILRFEPISYSVNLVWMDKDFSIRSWHPMCEIASPQ